jgi:hypothetical protein
MHVTPAIWVARRLKPLFNVIPPQQQPSVFHIARYVYRVHAEHFESSLTHRKTILLR